MKILFIIKKTGVMFENRPALYFCNYILITAYKLYIFDSVSKILFKLFMYKSQKFDLIVILIMEILLHNVYKPYFNPLTPRRTLVAPFTKISNLF